MKKTNYTKQLMQALQFQSEENYKDAEDLYLQLMKKNDNEIVRNNYGFLQLQQSQLKKAIEQFDIALRYNGIYAPALCNKGLALLAENNITDALTAFNKAIEINPDDLQININLAQVLMAAGEFEKAETCWIKILSIEPSVDHLTCYIETLLAAEKTAVAKHVLRMNDTWVEQNVKLLSFSGLINFMEFNYGEAIHTFRKALALEPDNADIRNLLANTFLKCGDKNSAYVEWKKILAINPANETAHNNLAVLELSDGKLDAALSDFNSILSNNPGNNKALYYKGYILKHSGLRDEAGKCFDAILNSPAEDYKEEARTLLNSTI